MNRLMFGLSMMLLVCIGCASSPEEAVVGKKPLHLYLLAGQSNMAGRGAVEALDTALHPRVFALRADMNWGPAVEPLHFDKPDIVGVGPGFAFGRAMAEADTSVLIGLIPAAVGGSSVRAWSPGAVHEQTNSRPYDDALSRTFRVLAQQGGELKGIIWHQGESDRNRVEGYEEELVALIKRFRKEFKNDSLPFVAAPLAAYYTDQEEGAKAVNEVIQRLPLLMPHLAVVSADGLEEKGDGVHLGSASSRELGRRYAEAMTELQQALP